MTDFHMMDEVIINTDTVFDEEGVPVSIRKGAHGRIWKVEKYEDEIGNDDGGWAQVIVWWESGYPGEEGKGLPEMLGVDVKHLIFHSHLKIVEENML